MKKHDFTLGLINELGLSENLAYDVNKYVQSILYPQQTKQDQIIQAVCEVCRVELKQLTAKNRFLNVREARQILSYLLRDRINLTFQEIGYMLNQDHVTIMYSCKKIEAFKEYDKRIIKLLGQIETKLTELQTT